MKILLINKYHHFVGGAEQYYFNLATLLTKKGHEIAFFSMEHPRNNQSKWNNYFVSNVSYDDKGVKKKTKNFFRMFYSSEAAQKITSLIDVFKPDLAHINNIYYHLSPSILIALKMKNIPIIYTVHDYHLVTPNVTFFHSGNLCTISLKNSLFSSVFHRCAKNSALVSLATASCLLFHDWSGAYKNTVDFFISPSHFMSTKLTDNGYPSKKIVHLSNFAAPTKRTKNPTWPHKKYVLYVGDTSTKKGVHILLEVAKQLPLIRFYIVGRKTETLGYSKTGGRLPLRNITLLGYVPHTKLKNILASSEFVIVPSLWYENQPYIILEAFSLGKPVIASNIGGIPELVKHGKNGLLFEPGNVDACVDRIKILWRNQALIQKLGKSAKKLARERFSPENHYKELMKLYTKAQRLHTL